MNIRYRVLLPDEIEKVCEQIMISYTSAYKGLMDQEYLSSLTANHWVDVLHESLQKGDNCLIAEHNGKIIGSTVFDVTHEDDEVHANWHAFYLMPEHIGQGIGHSFCQRIEAEMIKQGCKSCVLEVLSTNERAIGFYLSHGFTKMSTFSVEENGMVLSCDKMVKVF